jgi:hypothetical protein
MGADDAGDVAAQKHHEERDNFHHDEVMGHTKHLTGSARDHFLDDLSDAGHDYYNGEYMDTSDGDYGGSHDHSTDEGEEFGRVYDKHIAGKK